MSDQDDFYKAGCGIDALLDVNDDPPKPVLEQLGPAPFRSKGFPLLGFLATLYEHVAASSTAPTHPTGQNDDEKNKDE
jgi:hypothetical protein